MTRAAIVLALALAAAAPVMAAADGLPRLDPTNGANGTTYNFVMSGGARSMDPILANGTFAWTGTMIVFQDPQVPDLIVQEVNLDFNRDSVTDRVLRCFGFVGNKRVGLRCSQDDGGTDIRLLMIGNAVQLDSGKLALRKVQGRGFTESSLLTFAFAATQQ